MRIRDNIVRMYAMMTGQTQEQITIVSWLNAALANRLCALFPPPCSFLLFFSLQNFCLTLGFQSVL